MNGGFEHVKKREGFAIRGEHECDTGEMIALSGELLQAKWKVPES